MAKKKMDEAWQKLKDLNHRLMLVRNEIANIQVAAPGVHAQFLLSIDRQVEEIQSEFADLVMLTSPAAWRIQAKQNNVVVPPNGEDDEN